MKKNSIRHGLALLMVLLLVLSPANALACGGGSGGGAGNGNGLEVTESDNLEEILDDFVEWLEQTQNIAQRRAQLERRQRHLEAAQDLAFEGRDQYEGWMGTATDYGPAAIAGTGVVVGATATGPVGWGLLGTMALGAGMGAAGGGASALGEHLAGNDADAVQNILEGAAVGLASSLLPPAYSAILEGTAELDHLRNQSPDPSADSADQAIPILGSPGTR